MQFQHHAMGVCLACIILTSSVAFSASIPRNALPPTTDLDLITILDNGANNPMEGNEWLSDIASSIVSNLTGIRTQDESVQSTREKIENLFAYGHLNIPEAASMVASSGLVSSEILSFLNGFLNQSLNSIHNENQASSNIDIYPLKSEADAPYSVREDDLRAAIHIPNSFSYGKNGKKPLILVPGTAIPAGTTYHFNFAKFGNAVPTADVVWVNIPGSSFSDAQVNAEYVAYAIHYISSISNANVAMLSWSQGGLNVQWALKYWPSTRSVVDDFIAMSPDFHGTIARALVCPLLETVICTPSIWQQGWDTNFMQTIREDGGDSAYVPTTTIYSTFDEIVQPMIGDNASAIIRDIRGVGVTNNHLQSICPGKPAGGVYTHEGTLYNPLAWALAIDAFTHDGPGQPDRVNMEAACEQFLAPQLELDDILGTHGLLLVAVAGLLVYMPKTTAEPKIAAYALD
ncbi:hypothetical protein FE257_012068 [Aspergillus nanangensis]|uniref:Lipase n=1 Tax=Aspergillus nanangensis TaxID=2582783 RepID=A0AAD4CGQ9_ASPNN|nr:hypothetical protein FE257_012068 [Aspergillus nanangensis]